MVLPVFLPDRAALPWKIRGLPAEQGMQRRFSFEILRLHLPLRPPLPPLQHPLFLPRRVCL